MVKSGNIFGAEARDVFGGAGGPHDVSNSSPAPVVEYMAVRRIELHVRACPDVRGDGVGGLGL